MREKKKKKPLKVKIKEVDHICYPVKTDIGLLKDISFFLDIPFKEVKVMMRYNCWAATDYALLTRKSVPRIFLLCDIPLRRDGKLIGTTLDKAWVLSRWVIIRNEKSERFLKLCIQKIASKKKITNELLAEYNKVE